jgi:5-formyltetrahydrofolate cyclo-ligase
MRTSILALRDALPVGDRDSLSASITRRMLVLPEFGAAPTVLLNMPFRSEWDSARVARAALAAGKQVVLPRVEASKRVLTLHVVGSLEADVAPGFGGIPEPRRGTPQVAPSEIAFALVPGVAFDACGGRLGYGGGYYDRLLPALSPDALVVAAAFDVQRVRQVPKAGHDVLIDVLITPTATLRVGTG